MRTLCSRDSIPMHCPSLPRLRYKAERILEDLKAKPEEALVFANEPGDEDFLDRMPVVALETAPIEVVKGAQAVTYSAEKAGMSEVLEAMARLAQK